MTTDATHPPPPPGPPPRPGPGCARAVRRHRSGRGDPDRDRGYSTIEAVVTLPAVILFTMLVVQYALVWHGRHVAEAAAQDGLRAARGYRATAATGQVAATGYLTRVAPHLITGAAITTTRTPTTVTVSVRGQILSVVPLATFSTQTTISGPVERFVP